MASRLSREQLARAAHALNAASGFRALPFLILATDETRMSDPVAAALALPKGAGVILRHTDSKMRASLAETLARIARKRGLVLLIAGDAALAARVKADGLHLPEARASEAARWKTRRPDWIVTVAAHSLSALAKGEHARADAALLAPAFPTRSHMDRAALGLARFRLMAASSPLPIYALGGVDAARARRLRGARLAGLAAIEGLLPD